MNRRERKATFYSERGGVRSRWAKREARLARLREAMAGARCRAAELLELQAEALEAAALRLREKALDLRRAAI